MQRPSWTVLAGGGAAVALAAVIVVTRVDGDGSEAGCLPDLVGHLPPDVGVVSGTDLDRARDAGLEVDGTIEQVGKVEMDTALRLDPLTEQRVQFLDDGTDGTGFGVDDLQCGLGERGRTFVGRGSFDGDAVAGGTAGGDGRAEVADGGDLIAYDADGDPGSLLDPSSSSSASGSASADEAAGAQQVLTAAVQELDRHDVVTFDVLATGDGADATWVGMGLARGDGWDLLGVWSFTEAGQAAAERDDVVEAIAEGQVGEMIDGDPNAVVRQDGTVLWMRAPLTGEAADWTRPVAMFDPALTVVADFTDGN